MWKGTHNILDQLVKLHASYKLSKLHSLYIIGLSKDGVGEWKASARGIMYTVHHAKCMTILISALGL